MMKLKMIIAVLAFGMFFLTSCREKETTVILETKTESEPGALERAAKKADAEVNEKIDKTIDKIGNDN